MSTPPSGRRNVEHTIDNSPLGTIVRFQDTDLQASAVRNTVIFNGAKRGKTYRIEPFCPTQDCWTDSPYSPWSGADGRPSGGRITSGALAGHVVARFLVKMPGNSEWFSVGDDVKHLMATSDGDILGTFADYDGLYGDNYGSIPVRVRELDQDGAPDGDVNELACETFYGNGGTVPESGTQGLATFEILIRQDGIVNLVDNVELIGFYHTRANDIEMTLVSPRGTRVRLADRYDTDDAYDGDYGDYLFQEASAREQESENGRVVPQDARPIASFSAFIGEKIAGTWKLEIRDYKNLDLGLLTGWGLQICHSTKLHDIYEAPPPLEGIRDVVLTLADPNYYDIGYGNGSWSTTFPDNPAIINFLIPYAGIVVRAESVSLRIDHGQAGDLHCVLQSPSGTKVTVFHRPGFTGSGTGNPDRFQGDGICRFLDPLQHPGENPDLPDSGNIAAGNYNRDPGNWPGMTPPNDELVTIGDFDDFAGEPVTGIWKVYVYDWDEFDGYGGVMETHLSVRFTPV